MRGVRIIDHKLVETGAEVITLAEAKTTLHLTDSDNDAEITALIKKARRWCENYCGISIIGKTVTLFAEFYEEWELPYGPVKELVSVQQRKSMEGSGVTQFESADNWHVEGDEFKTFLPGPGWGIFTFSLRSINSSMLKLIYTTGYTTIPDDLKEGILNVLVYMYEHRGEENVEPPIEAIDKIIPYKRMLWF